LAIWFGASPGSANRSAIIRQARTNSAARNDPFI
jgi:hypothetical protein